MRAQADARVAAEGFAGMLAELDAATAARIDRQNGARVQRAWEVLQATGRGLAEWQDNTGAPDLPLTRAEALVLQPDVDWLNGRIDQRFHAMIAAGALDEVAAALPEWNPGLPSSRAIGAPELIAYLRGESTLSEAIFNSITASRQYAKRQRTWFRNRMQAWRKITLP